MKTKMLTRACLATFLFAAPNTAFSQQQFKNELIYRQLSESIAAKQKPLDTSVLAKISVTAGSVAFLYTLKEHNGISEIRSIIDACYAEVSDLELMSRLMACFVFDFSFLNRASSFMKKPELKEDAFQRTNSALKRNGIFHEPLLQKINSDFFRAWQNANNWLERKTFSELQNCLKFGVGTRNCS